jgi:hypothetical protein
MFDAFCEAKPAAAISYPHCVLPVRDVAFDAGRNDSVAGQILPGSGN